MILYQIFLGISNSKSVSRREVNGAWQKTLRPVTGTGMDRYEIGHRFTILSMTAGQNGTRKLEDSWTRRRTINLLRESARKIKMAIAGLEFFQPRTSLFLLITFVHYQLKSAAHTHRPRILTSIKNTLRSLYKIMAWIHMLVAPLAAAINRMSWRDFLRTWVQ